MIRWVLCGFLWASPAPAQSTAAPIMTSELCKIGWAAFAKATSQASNISDARPDVTANGWCRVDKSNTALTRRDFETMEWRARGTQDAVTFKGFPVNLEMHATGIDLEHGFGLKLPSGQQSPQASLSIDFDRSQHDFSFALRDLTADFGTLGWLSVQLRGGGIDLSSAKSMQIGLGGLRAYSARVQLQSAGGLGKALMPFAFTQEGRKVVDALPSGAIDFHSRAALQAFLATRGTTGGRLTIEAETATGLGILQITGALMQMDQGNGAQANYTEGLNIMLRGVTLKVNWQPDL